MRMNLFADITFGALQGLTEFLPISSSGHLVIFHELFGLTGADDLTFDAILQLGTMLALLVTFRQDLWRLTQNGFHWLKGKRTTEIQRDFNLICAIIIGTIPAIGLGLFLQKWMETIFRHSWLVAIVLLLGSGLMFLAEKTYKPRATPLNLKSGLSIGLFQCLALIPGMSRSGSTISGGLLQGLSREQATRFSFLLSIPIITGSGLLKLTHVIQQPSHTYSPSDLILSFTVSFIVGSFAINWLLRFLKTHRLFPFIWYRLGLATLVLLWTAFGF